MDDATRSKLSQLYAQKGALITELESVQQQQLEPMRRQLTAINQQIHQLKSLEAQRQSEAESKEPAKVEPKIEEKEG